MNRAIDAWDGPRYVAPLARTEDLIFVGSDSTELSLGYDAIAPEILRGFAAARRGARRGSYRHTGLWVGAAADGETGWWVQEMDFRFESEGELWAYPFRISGFALEEGGIWKVHLAHASLPVEPDEASRFIRPPARARAAGAGSRDGEPGGAAGLRAVVGELAESYNSRDMRGWLELFAPDPDVQLVGWAPGDVHASRESVRAYLNEFASRFKGPGFFVSDSLVVRTRQRAGWWYEKGRLRFGTALDARELPYRTTGAAVRDGGRWRVVQYHADIPVPNDSVAVFSRPVRE